MLEKFNEALFSKIGAIKQLEKLEQTYKSYERKIKLRKFK